MPVVHLVGVDHNHLPAQACALGTPIAERLYAPIRDPDGVALVAV